MWMLEDAVWNLQEYCEYLRETIVWSGGLAERNDDSSDDHEVQGELKEGRNSNKVVIHLPPPVWRSSCQLM